MLLPDIVNIKLKVIAAIQGIISDNEDQLKDGHLTEASRGRLDELLSWKDDNGSDHRNRVEVAQEKLDELVAFLDFFAEEVITKKRLQDYKACQKILNSGLRMKKSVVEKAIRVAKVQES